MELGRQPFHQALLKCQIPMYSSVLSLLIIEINVLDRISQCKLIFSEILFLFMHLMRENIFLGVRDVPCNTYIHTCIHKLYLSSDFSVAYKLVSPILITNFKSYSKNKAKKRKIIHNLII